MEVNKSSLFYSFLLKCLNAIFSLILNISDFVERKKFAIRHMVYSYRNPKYESSYILTAKDELKNLPHHISFAIEAEEGEISLEDILKLIQWSELLEIPYISLYDDYGTIVGMRDKVEEAFLGSKKDIKKSKSAKDIIASRNNGSSTPKAKNFFQHGSSKVMLLDPSDGRKAIVDSVIELCSRPRNGKGNQINLDSIASNLREKYRFPEPDIVVKFGPTFSMFGYPPLALRISEIFTHSTHSNFTVFQFVETLKLYQKRERRCGK